MRKHFSGEEFALALVEGSLIDPLVLTGMIKRSETDSTILQFTPSTVCENWVPIPIKMIEAIDRISKVPCRDHAHEYVQLTLKEPTNPEAAVYAGLLRRHIYDSALQPAAGDLITPYATGIIESTSAITPFDPKLECFTEYGCPTKIRTCAGKDFCEVIDCGAGACPSCPPPFNTLIIKGWCAYTCYKNRQRSGSAFVLIPRIGTGIIGPICLN
jgi:hypothetical protein